MEIPFSHKFVEALRAGKTIINFDPDCLESQCIKKIKEKIERG